ncbi:hypothetical protein QM272_19870, partial [Acinetobacter baumannii]|nr:hypothetical protein [Acinetobacter baumannii]
MIGVNIIYDYQCMFTSESKLQVMGTVNITDREWHRELSPEEYRIT